MNRIGLALCATLVISGCGSLPQGAPERAGPPAARASDRPALAQGWQARLPHGGHAADLARWWSQFDDAALDEFIAAAQRESGSLAQAAARIAQAQAAAVAAGAGARPTLDLAAGASRGTINIGTQILLANQARLTVQSGWEVDLFGRLAREREAAGARLQARSADWHDARVSVAAEVAAQYLQLRYCEALAGLAQADAESRARTADITGQASRAGLQSAATSALARAAASEATARAAAQRTECDVLVKALVALTALPEADLRAKLRETSGRLPTPRAFEVTSVPASLLSQRPDLAAAERSVAAASADVGVADADRYPRLSLTGSVGPLRIEAMGAGTTLTTWSIGPALTLPLFDGGRRSANLAAARVMYAAAEADFRARARQAVREVEEALVRLHSAGEREREARAASDGQQAVLDAAQTRWTHGLGSLLDLEEARRQHLSSQSTLAAVRRDRIAAWVALYRALGGGWTNTNEESSR